MYKRVIYWFKRDLRIDDNKAFLNACKDSQELIPLFIFNPSLLENFKSYDRRLGFLIDCVRNLDEKIKNKGGKLFCFYDEPAKVFEKLIKKYKPQAVYTNKTFSYLGEATEDSIKTLCSEKGIDFVSITDNFLSDIINMPYKKVFGAFYRQWVKNLRLDIYPEPEKIRTPQIAETEISDIVTSLRFEKNYYWQVDYGEKRIKDFDYVNYEKTRDRLDIEGTSKLSPYIRFGTVSLRRVFHQAEKKAGRDCQFIKELAWREFWYHIKINFPELKQLEFQQKRRNITWENNEKFIKAFQDAQTGYPIIDAAIKQLKTENWMHNRARMIVASFLTKDLLVDWRIGEEFFKEYLIDYDEVVNIGNWQWNASVGPDPKPLRIFNPMIQSKKFDPECKFIKKYVPELKNVSAYMLHDPINYEFSYVSPIVSHLDRAIRAKKIWLNQ